MMDHDLPLSNSFSALSYNFSRYAMAPTLRAFPSTDLLVAVYTEDNLWCPAAHKYCHHQRPLDLRTRLFRLGNTARLGPLSNASPWNKGPNDATDSKGLIYGIYGKYWNFNSCLQHKSQQELHSKVQLKVSPQIHGCFMHPNSATKLPLDSILPYTLPRTATHGAWWCLISISRHFINFPYKCHKWHENEHRNQVESDGRPVPWSLQHLQVQSAQCLRSEWLSSPFCLSLDFRFWVLSTTCIQLFMMIPQVQL